MSRREQLTIQQSTPTAQAATSLTRNGTVATVTMPAPHGFTNGDFVQIAGAVPAGYNGTVKITVPSSTASTFTYPTSSSLATPATGAITVTYVSDAQGGTSGGTGQGWTTVRTIYGELIPINATERLQAAALQSQLDYRFRVNAIDAGGLTAMMRALWTPQWPLTGRTEHTLEIHGVLPDADGHQTTLLDCGEIR
jgi:head-tail adaptor